MNFAAAFNLLPRRRRKRASTVADTLFALPVSCWLETGSSFMAALLTGCKRFHLVRRFLVEARGNSGAVLNGAERVRLAIGVESQNDAVIGGRRRSGGENPIEAVRGILAPEVDDVAGGVALNGVETRRHGLPANGEVEGYLQGCFSNRDVGGQSCCRHDCRRQND